MNHQGTKIIDTNRLILRPFKLSDALDMFNNWASDDRVTKFLSWSSHKSLEETKAIIKEWIESYSRLNFYNWVVELKETHSIIGSIAVVNLEEKKSLVEFGYCLGYNYWNKGYTSEALKKLVEYFFEVINVKKVQAKHDINNTASGKVMLKALLKYESKSLGNGYNNKGICDTITYSLMDYEYFEKQISEDIKIAKQENLDLVVCLLNKIYKTDYLELYNETKKAIQTRDNIFFLYKDIAVAHLSIRSDYVNGKEFDFPCGFLEGIYVDEEFRNQKIGFKLLKVIEDYLIKNGYKELLSDCLINNHNSEMFHKKFGFKEVERTISFQKRLDI